MTYFSKNKRQYQRGAAWTRKAGKNPSGGLNAKGRASYRAANPGSKLAAPVTESNPSATLHRQDCVEVLT